MLPSQQLIDTRLWNNQNYFSPQILAFYSYFKVLSDSGKVSPLPPSSTSLKRKLEDAMFTFLWVSWHLIPPFPNLDNSRIYGQSKKKKIYYHKNNNIKATHPSHCFNAVVREEQEELVGGVKPIISLELLHYHKCPWSTWPLSSVNLILNLVDYIFVYKFEHCIFEGQYGLDLLLLTALSRSSFPFFCSFLFFFPVTCLFPLSFHLSVIPNLLT